MESPADTRLRSYAASVSPEPAKETKAPRQKRPATLARAYFGALDSHDVDAAAALWQPGSTDRVVGMAELSVPGEFKDWFRALFTAIPDLSFEVVSITAQKERAAVQWTARGTFDGTGRFEGLSPNGAKVEMEGFDLMTARDGLIVENHGYLNGAEMARQLGALPPQGSLAERGMTGALNAKVAAAKLLERARSR